MSYELIEVSTQEAVGIIRLDRPKAYNALCNALVAELGQALDVFEADEAIGAIVLTGGEKVFAAGADIGEMLDREHADLFLDDFPYVKSHGWERLNNCRKPTIAAVSGFALGGGCEMAMACDIILASDTAKFGQPEVKIGTMPGAGGTQRLVRAIGKAKAMELCLTGRMMDAEEAEQAGLVCRVVPVDALMEEALTMAATIASHSRPVVMQIREAVEQAFETGLQAGLLFERRAFQATFNLADRKEGMSAFAEKRKPVFRHR
ncbi:enoyl-CoA hydratase-related protein [Vreelandella rituensis]|uniref:enoyl-CoA hydratase n=1 Tax=Vreelandella rituensis TaxID=2282306 RepID=A0A368TN61_9GAMM|nr:enoyl-CoA hydratase-related protein [Halomonas rituensis]RCV86149.1 enoyl-CoA hydratase [Halomonas rituensis]